MVWRGRHGAPPDGWAAGLGSTSASGARRRQSSTPTPARTMSTSAMMHAVGAWMRANVNSRARDRPRAAVPSSRRRRAAVVQRRPSSSSSTVVPAGAYPSTSAAGTMAAGARGRRAMGARTSRARRENGGDYFVSFRTDLARCRSRSRTDCSPVRPRARRPEVRL